VGYSNTFIAVAEDCPATTGRIPAERTGGPTVARVQYCMLAGAPGHWTQEDVQLASSPGVRGRDNLSEVELGLLRREYFARPRACLRASPLPKAFGWGLHYDTEGHITLFAVDSDEYAKHRNNPALTQLRALRSSR
jgi:hypothetical protein